MLLFSRYITMEVNLEFYVNLLGCIKLRPRHITVKLDIYEGIAACASVSIQTPESKIALSKINDFLKTYLIIRLECDFN